MSCPNIGILEQSLTFTAQFTNESREPTDLDALPTYKIYEEVTNTEIDSGELAKQDDANTVGFYVKKIEATTANGYETLKTYTIRVKGVASGVNVATVFSFICLGQSDLTVATGDLLTTVERFKLYMGITTSDNDTLIGQLISRSTNAIQKFCNRDFVETTYRDFYDGDGQSELVLSNFPVIAVTLLGIGREDAFGIQNTSSDAYNAQVSITESDMTLQVMGGTNDGAETLTLASYSTLTALFVAITALNKGWSVTETATLSIWAASELLPTGKGLQCLTDVANPQIPSEPASDFTTDVKAGILKYFGRFCVGFNNVIVKYTAGYVEIPADLEQICIDLTKTYYDASSGNLNSNMKKEKIGDYEYEIGGTAQLGVTKTTGIPSTIAGRLRTWSTMV
jgi:hypothetical protein